MLQHCLKPQPLTMWPQGPCWWGAGGGIGTVEKWVSGWVVYQEEWSSTHSPLL